MASVTEGFLLGTHEGLTFYLLRGRLCVRRKSSLSRHRVLYSPGFEGTRQSAGEMGRASKIASRVYRELSGEQKRMVYVLFKKMTGVAKIALKWGKSEGEAEGAVRQYLVEMGVTKKDAVREEKKEFVTVRGRIRKSRTAKVPKIDLVRHRESVKHFGQERRKRPYRKNPIDGNEPPCLFVPAPCINDVAIRSFLILDCRHIRTILPKVSKEVPILVPDGKEML